MAAIRAAIVGVLEQDHPQTVRQLYYQLTTVGVVEKTDAEYQGTVCRLTAEMRRSGEIPYHWLADATRWMRKPTTYSSAAEALRHMAATYRRSLWDDAPVLIEIWLEKDALAGVLVDVTAEWDVPLMVTRGYPSISFLHSAAEAIRERGLNGQQTAICYFGDHDPSGRDIDRAIVQGIGESLTSLRGERLFIDDDALRVQAALSFGKYARFERLGVTADQAARLPSRPTKRNKHNHLAKHFVGPSVEVDAIPAVDLKAMAETAIERHVDQRKLDVLRTFEAEEQNGLIQLAALYGRDEGAS